MTEATESRRAAAAKRAEFRTEVVAALQQYGEMIETLRVELHRVQDGLKAAERAVYRDPAAAGDCRRTIERAWEEVIVGLDEWVPEEFEHVQLKDLMPELFEPDIDAALQDKARRRFEPAYKVVRPPEQAALEPVYEASASLDREWARVRPLLDDLLAPDAVWLLRRTRHTVRDFVRQVSDAIQEIDFSSAVGVRRGIHQIVNLLDLTNRWAAQIAALRIDIREDRLAP